MSNPDFGNDRDADVFNIGYGSKIALSQLTKYDELSLSNTIVENMGVFDFAKNTRKLSSTFHSHFTHGNMGSIHAKRVALCAARFLGVDAKIINADDIPKDAQDESYVDQIEALYRKFEEFRTAIPDETTRIVINDFDAYMCERGVFLEDNKLLCLVFFQNELAQAMGDYGYCLPKHYFCNEVGLVEYTNVVRDVLDLMSFQDFFVLCCFLIPEDHANVIYRDQVHTAHKETNTAMCLGSFVREYKDEKYSAYALRCLVEAFLEKHTRISVQASLGRRGFWVAVGNNETDTFNIATIHPNDVVSILRVLDMVVEFAPKIDDKNNAKKIANLITGKLTYLNLDAFPNLLQYEITNTAILDRDDEDDDEVVDDDLLEMLSKARKKKKKKKKKSKDDDDDDSDEDCD